MNALALLALVVAPVQGDPASDLKSKEFDVRLAAVEALADGSHAEASKLLRSALKDDDWEVVERAALALGDLADAKAFDPLVKLALEGPVRAVRRTAAEALAKIDAEEAYAKLARKAGGKGGLSACEGMASLSPALTGTEKPVSVKALEKALKGKDAPTRHAAARALVLLDREERLKRFHVLASHEDMNVVCGALEAAGESGDATLSTALLDALAHAKTADVAERRALEAYRALVVANEPLRADLCDAVRQRIANAMRAEARARMARLVAALGGKRGDGEPLLDAAEALAYLEPALSSTEAATRAAGAWTLGRLGQAGGEGAIGRAEVLAKHDESARVRLVAMESFVLAKGIETPEVQDLLLSRLSDDEHPRVREMAAVYLGQKGAERVISSLVDALRDTDWNVRICAAVSLGKTRHANASDPLVKLYQGDGDWKERGAAIVGMSKIGQKSVIPTVIDALDDPEPVVSRTAYEYLCEVARRRLDRKRDVWVTWWAENEKRVKLFDPEEEKKRRERFGYSDHRSTSEMYKGLDVLIFESRGDHIQNVLEGLDVSFRLTRQGSVLGHEPYPGGVFVSNCTGEMNGEDVEALAWFVRCGGYLFGSCWAVQETIARAYEGVVRRLPTRGEVLDRVHAEPCAVDSPYLEGVFDQDVSPIYTLEGAYLIEVLNPERVEVLVDSPECAAIYGGGNLAGWFRAGHGIALDSVNHFDLQGLERAEGLRKPEDRMAFAIDHMGITYEELREIRGEKFWSKGPEAAKRVKDLSVIRLITNFVRLKRLRGE